MSVWTMRKRSCPVFQRQCSATSVPGAHDQALSPALALTVQRSVCVCEYLTVFSSIPGFDVVASWRRWSQQGGVILILSLSFGEKRCPRWYFGLRQRNPSRFLDGGNAEVFRERKARVSVACRFLGLGVSLHILVSVAGVAFQQQLGQIRWGGVQAQRQSQAGTWGDARGGAGVCDGFWSFGHNQGKALCLVAWLVIGIVDVATGETLQLSQVHGSFCVATCWGLMGGCIWGGLSLARRRWSWGSTEVRRAEVGAVAVIAPRISALWGRTAGVSVGGSGGWQWHGLSVSQCFLPPEVFQNPGPVRGVPQVFSFVLQLLASWGGAVSTAGSVEGRLRLKPVASCTHTRCSWRTRGRNRLRPGRLQHLAAWRNFMVDRMGSLEEQTGFSGLWGYRGGTRAQRGQTQLWGRIVGNGARHKKWSEAGGCVVRGTDHWDSIILCGWAIFHG